MEYKVVEIAGAYLTSIQRELNDLAADNWELVTVENHRMYLRRQKKFHMAPVYDIRSRINIETEPA